MSALTQDFGADQYQAEQIKAQVADIPDFPGLVTFEFHESAEVPDGLDTFDTAEGRPHSLGRSKTSKDWSAQMYSNRTVELAALEAWYQAARTGRPGYQRNMTITYFATDGTPGRTVELEGCFPVNRTDAASGQQTAAMVNWSFKYWRANVINV